MSAALEPLAAVIWIITALVWIGACWQAHKRLDPLEKEMQQAIKDSEAARLGLSSDYKSAVERPHTDYVGGVGSICPRCGRTTYGGSDSPLGLKYCGYCGAPLAAR